MGLTTVLGLERHGFFIPYRYAGGIKDDAAPYAALEDLFAERRDIFAAFLERIDDLRDDLLAIDGTGADRCRWDQDWFPRLDAAAAYTMVRTHKPPRIIEVGSGHSTRFMLRAIADGSLATQVTAIDPAPRATLEDLPVTLERKTLQEADDTLFDSVASGDLVCIDSSHIMMPGTDVDIAVNRILPRLKPGTLVFFHDILLPDTLSAPVAVARIQRTKCRGTPATGRLGASVLEPLCRDAIGATDHVRCRCRPSPGGRCH